MKRRKYSRDELYKAGVFKPKHIIGLDLRARIAMLKKIGYNKTGAVKKIASEMNHSESYIWGALKSVIEL